MRILQSTISSVDAPLMRADSRLLQPDAVQPAENDGLPLRRRVIAASAVCLAVIIMTLDTAMIAVALPAIGHDLHISASSSIWIVNTFLISVVCTLLPLAALGEAIGYRKIYLAGLALFFLGSTACFLSNDFVTLIVARLFQGLGAAGVMAVNGAIVRFIYPAKILQKGVGLTALMAACASAAGPVFAAAILAIGNWRVIFGLNIPLSLVALLLGSRTLPGQSGVAGGIDTQSALLNAVSMGLIAFAFVQVTQLAFNWSTLAALAVGAMGLAALVRRSRQLEHPMLPLDLLRLKKLRFSYAASIFAFSAQMIAMISLPFILRYADGYDATTIGLILSAWPIGIAVGAIVAGRAGPTSLGRITLVGLAILGSGLTLFALIAVKATISMLVASSFISGTGFGLFQTPNNSIMIIASDVRRSGAAAGLQGASRVAGQILGAALAALCFGLFGPATVAPLLVAILLVVLASASANARPWAGT